MLLLLLLYHKKLHRYRYLDTSISDYLPQLLFILVISNRHDIILYDIFGYFLLGYRVIINSLFVDYLPRLVEIVYKFIASLSHLAFVLCFLWEC